MTLGFYFPLLDFKKICLVPFMLIVIAVNNDKFLHFCIQIWLDEVEEEGVVVRLKTSQGFNGKQLAIT